MRSGRRNFLHLAGAAPATALAGLVGAGVAQAASSARSSVLARSTFTPLVGEEFVFETSALETARARLVKVDGLAHAGPARDPEGAFRLLFETVPGDALKQQTFPVSHPRLGRFALFVSPNDSQGRVVEAIFNRL